MRALRCLLTGLVATAATLLVLAGCGRAPHDPNSVNVVVWAAPPGEAAALNRAIADFTAETGLSVKLEVITDKYMDVMRSRFAARNPPDVFYLDTHEAPFLIKSGVLAPLDATVLPNPTDFYPQFLAAFRGADGQVYGAPKDYSTLALYINTTLLAQAGFKLSDVPTDQAELMVFARKLQAKLPKGVGALIFEKDLARHLSAIEAYGTPLIDDKGNAQLANNPGATAYLEAFVLGRKAGAVLSPKDDLGADSPSAAFGGRRTVMAMEGNWMQGSLRHDYADVKYVTREMPTVNGRHHTMAFVVGYSVGRDAKNVAGGRRFAQYMTTTGMKAWSIESGTLPTRLSVQAEIDASPGGTNPLLRAHVAGGAYATVWSRGIGLPVINQNFGNQFLAAVNGSKSVAAALAQAEATANREIERQQ